MKKFCSLCLALAMVLTMVPLSARAAQSTYGSDLWLQDIPLQDGVTLSENVYWSHYYDKPRREHFVT